MNKRGISAIVATVLVVLISVVSIGILWGAVIPLVNQNLEIDEVSAQLSIESSEGYTAYDPTNGRVSIQMKNSGEGVIDKAKIIIRTDSGNTYAELVDPPGKNQKITYYFSWPHSELPVQVSAAPLFLKGNDYKEGIITSTIDFDNGTVDAFGLTFGSGGICVDNGDCDDSNACTTDSCSLEVCINAGDVAAGTSCTGGVCDGSGSCVECVDNGDCSAGQECVSNVCQAAPECTVNGDCDDSNSCTYDICSSGSCENNPVGLNSSCTSGSGVCTASQQCVECIDDGNCNSGEVCNSNVCGAAPECTVATEADDCNDLNDCTEDVCNFGSCAYNFRSLGYSCMGSGFCDGAGACEACVIDEHCAAGEVCVAGGCQATGGSCSGTIASVTPSGTTCSSEYGGSYICSNARDGAISTKWFTKSKGGGDNDRWIILDLGSSSCFKGVRTYQSSTSYDQQRTHIEVSSDGNSWTLLDLDWPILTGWRENNFTEQEDIRYVRLNISDDVHPYGVLNELEVWARSYA